MWGRALTLIGLPLAVVLLLIAIAFGTSAVLFQVLLSGAILFAVAGIYGAWRGQERVSNPGEPGGRRRPSGAPLSEEG